VSAGRVVLLAGPSGCGKSHLAKASGLPVLCLDEFYKHGDDPTLPRHPDLGIVDWDHPAAWDEDRAVQAILEVCHAGTTEVPRYDISRDRALGTQPFSRGDHPVFLAEGIFAGELVGRCREAGVLADAIVIERRPWTNFVRRLSRDLAEHRKPPLTLLRRGQVLMASEKMLLATLRSAGCRPLRAAQTRQALAGWAAARQVESG
jgi:uridine kinase